MSTPATITIGGSTVVAPSNCRPFGNSDLTVIVPIDGNVIVQRSANSDSTGDKNARRTMTWEGLPTSDSRWTHTPFTLMALEGTTTTVTMGTLWGSIYIFSTSIKIIKVDIGEGRFSLSENTEIWPVEITYTHL